MLVCFMVLVRVYCFEYLDEDWAKNPQRRQLIVRANNSRGRSVEVVVRHLR